MKVDYVATFAPGSNVEVSGIEDTFKKGITDGQFGSFKVDPTSASFACMFIIGSYISTSISTSAHQLNIHLFYFLIDFTLGYHWINCVLMIPCSGNITYTIITVKNVVWFKVYDMFILKT